MMKPQLQFLYWKWFHFVGRICSKEGKDREGEYRRNTGCERSSGEGEAMGHIIVGETIAVIINKQPPQQFQLSPFISAIIKAEKLHGNDEICSI